VRFNRTPEKNPGSLGAKSNPNSTGFWKKTRKNSGEGYGIVRFNRVPEKVPGSLGVKSK
jgi:hypothetical protein